MATTISLTMTDPSDELLTLALHYPLFLLIGWTAAQTIPRDWWSLLYASLMDAAVSIIDRENIDSFGFDIVNDVLRLTT
jgi:hypothetical protein